MCGIVGAAGDLTVKEERAFKDLLLINSLRGSDSTGVASVFRNDTVNLLKQVGDPYSLMDSKKYNGIFAMVPKVLIGHGRWATQGNVTRANAHPFELEKIIGCHNGTVKKFPFKDGNAFETDSEAFLHHIEVMGIKDAIAKAVGAYALTWYNTQDKTMNFIRNRERPLSFTLNKAQTAMFWASEAWMLHGALQRNGIERGEIYDLPEDCHYKYEIPSILNPFNKPVVTRIVHEVSVAPFSIVEKGSTDIVRKPTTITQGWFSKYKMDRVAGEEISLKPSYLSKDKHGGQFVLMKSDSFSGLDFRIYVNTTKEGSGILNTPNWVGKVKEVGIDKDCFKLDQSSLKKLKEEKAILVIKKDHKGEYISKFMFDNRYKKGCSWCSQNIEHEDEWTAKDENTILCEDCMKDKEVLKYIN